MMKNLGIFFRRRSITERELQKDYPTFSDSDDDTDEETRRRKWQINLNRRTSDRMDDFSDNVEDDNWEYESEYNYSIQSESMVIDAYKERRYSENPKLYSDRDLERRIEQTMRNEVMDGTEQKVPRRQSDDKKDRHRSLSPVNETVRKFEHNFSKRRASAVPQIRLTTDRRQSGDSNGKSINTYGKKKQRKQNKQRRRAREISSDMSDEDVETKYAVNLSMDDLNDLIKKNISSAVKSIVSKSKCPRAISPSESFSTETETIFSGSSTQSTDIPPGLLAKQIKAQLDKDRLKGIIRKAVAKETYDVYNKMSGNEQNRVTTAPTLPDFQHSAHMNPYATHTQMIPQSSCPSSGIPPAPPVPTVPSIPQVTFTLPDGNLVPPSMPSYHNGRRLSLTPQLLNSSLYDQDNYQNTMMQMEQQPSPFLDGIVLPPGAMNRLQNRRHTLATLGSSSEGPSVGDGFDTKIEQFSNALKLLDQTIQKAESGSSKDKQTEQENNSSTANKVKVVSPQAQNVPELGPIATIPGGIFAPVMSVADQIKALSKKKDKKPLQPGEIEMSAWARGFLILTNMIFLISGGGVIALGVWLMMDPNIETYFHIINVDQSGSDFKMICYGLIAVGVFALGIAFLGCCGSIQRSKCMMTMFLVMVGVLTLLETGLGAMLMMNQDSPTAIPVLSSILSDMENSLKSQLKMSLVTTYLPETMMGSTWDLVQKHLECCGATGAEDYKTSKWQNETRPETDFPDTCCVLIDKEAEVPEPSNKLLCHFGTAGFYYETGCFDKMIGWFKDNSTYIVIAAIVVVVIEVVAFVSAFVICRKAVKAEKIKKAAKQNVSASIFPQKNV